MKRILLLFSAVGMLSTAAWAGLDPTIDYSSISGALLTFEGGGSSNFRFVNDVPGPGGRSFQIRETENFTAAENLALVDLLGEITGTFTLGSISSTSFLGMTIESAAVSDNGAKYMVYDGSGSAFSADLDFLNMTTIGTGGIINATGTVNLSNFQYSGTNVGLARLASYPAGIVTSTFTFTPAQTLNSLVSGGGRTAFEGTLRAVPEPAHYAALLTGGLGFALWLSRRRRAVASLA